MTSCRFDSRRLPQHNLRFPAGGVPEWLKGADCKSVGLRLRWFESSLLHQHHVCAAARDVASTAGTNRGGRGRRDAELRRGKCVQDAGGCSSMVEQKPSKLTTRVRFPSPAPRTVNEVLARTSKRSQGKALAVQGAFLCPCGSVVEHSLGKGEVTRSIRVMGTNAVKSGPCMTDRSSR